jgi:PucR C-terminal helix-turn-helix domain
MARARSSENSVHEGDHRGAASAAPRSAPAGGHLHGARSFLELLEIHRRVEREALAVEAQRLGLDLANGDFTEEADSADRPAAALLSELRDTGLATAGDAEERTYRLLVGVLLNDPHELRDLRSHTIASLEQYDALHDTELVVTLENFLAHHGSTTDTADAMQLHRHTVGYRLTRIHEVAGLSPYESEGRERLSLGLKAKRILLAQARQEERGRPT